MKNPKERDLYLRAKQMGVTDTTAKDYIRTVTIQAKKIYLKQQESRNALSVSH